MKTLLTLILLLVLNVAQGQQYFQYRFNLNVTPTLRNERFNSGVRTLSNYDANNPYFYAAIGTSYNNPALAAPHNVADRLRFTRMNTLGNAVLSNLGYQFSTDEKILHASGNSIAEINSAAGNGGYIAVGTVTSNSTTGAVADGGSDVLFTRLTAAGAVVWAKRLDLEGGSDIAWYIKRSSILVGGQPTWIICGQSKQGATYTDSFVARVDINGTVIWCFRYNFDPGGGLFNSAHCIAKQLCEDTAGNIYVVGTLQDNTGANGIDGLAFKLTPAGAVLWANNYNLASDDEFQAVRFTTDANLIVGGFTNAGGAYNMQITKLFSANGVIQFQNILRAGNGDNFFPSKCYDILQAPNQQYYLAGLLIRNGINYEMMYRTQAGGTGINWNSYNRMVYNVGFGISYVPGDNCPGIAYFSSMRNPTNVAFSDGHIMKTNLATRTCNFEMPKPPINAPSNLVKFARPHKRQSTHLCHNLTSATFNYLNWAICWVGCPNPVGARLSVAPQVAEQHFTRSQLSIAPNPAHNTVHIAAHSLPAGEYQIELVDMQGRVIQKRTDLINQGSLTTDLDLSSVAPGIYLLRVTKGSLVLQEKVIKQ